MQRNCGCISKRAARFVPVCQQRLLQEKPLAPSLYRLTQSQYALHSASQYDLQQRKGR